MMTLIPEVASESHLAGIVWGACIMTVNKHWSTVLPRDLEGIIKRVGRLEFFVEVESQL